jgi:hypothetical protein
MSRAKGIGQGRQEGELAQALATARISDPATLVGCGTLIRLGLAQPKDEQGLREAGCHQRGIVYIAMTRLMVRRLARA